MCLDPRPESLLSARRAYRAATRQYAASRVNRQATPDVSPTSAFAPYQTLEFLAAQDDLVARGWVLITREA